MRAIVTGANGDIGFSIAGFLIKNTFKVTAIDKHTSRLSAMASPHVDILELNLADL